MPASNAVFIDTSGWIALLNADDRLHAQAIEQLHQLGSVGRALITTDWVFAEAGNGLARAAAHDRVVQAIRVFLQSPNARLVRVDEEIFQRALTLYEQAMDKTWGLVDCASFVVMRNQGVVDALTSDHHFEQAGFRCLLPTA
jgi:predicted nucleic acid-binding protein